MSRHRSSARRRSAIGGALLLVLVICAFVAVSITGFRPLGANAAEDPVTCTLSVPADPLSATGLATPYKLSGDGCRETDKTHSAFVQATVIDTTTGTLYNYTPLVITRGTRPAVAPVVPKLPAHRVVGIWFGFNGDNLRLRGTQGSLQAGSCVNGAAGSIFGQYAYCNAPAFFTAANSAIKAGQLTVPDIGTGSDGLPCPTVRDFGIVDQDQSDNVTSKYFAVDGRTAQGTSANAASLKRGQILTNASDNGLVDNALDPALGCSPWTVQDLGDAMQPSNSLALDELQAAAHQAAPAALVPLNNPMVLAGDRQSPVKTDAYRAGVDMPPLSVDPGQSPADYCRLMTASGWQRIQTDKALLRGIKSPDPLAATNLYTFLGSRIAGSYDNLHCARLLKKANPFQVTMHGNVAVSIRKGVAIVKKVVQQPVAVAKAPTPTKSVPVPAPSTVAPKPRHSMPMVTPAKAAAAPTPTPSAHTPTTSKPTPTPTPKAMGPKPSSSRAPKDAAPTPTTGPIPTPTHSTVGSKG